VGVFSPVLEPVKNNIFAGYPSKELKFFPISSEVMNRS
jgi:hypothetical protein